MTQFAKAIEAIQANDLEALKTLLEAAPQIVQERDDLAETLLHKARDPQAVDLLIQHGSDIHAKDSFGYTPLHLAAHMGAESVAKLLIEHGADVNMKNDWGHTPLHKAVYSGAEGAAAVAELLIRHGADVNAKDNGNNTPLHRAACADQTACAELLIQHGADVNAKDDWGFTPLHTAVEAGSEGVVRLLVHRSIDRNACNVDGYDPERAVDLAIVRLYDGDGYNNPFSDSMERCIEIVRQARIQQESPKEDLSLEL